MTDTTTPEIPVHVIVVLDESGSMLGLRSDLIGGVNSFLAEQRAQPGKCRLTLVKFAPYTVIHDATKIGKVGDLTPADYRPHSNTPLLDAEGAAITTAMARATARAAAGKPEEAVMFVTYTDGEENASREWTFDALSKLKKEREEAGWTFLYMGAGHDAYGQSTAMGTNFGNTISVAADSVGIGQTFMTTSAIATGYRRAATRGRKDILLAASANAYEALDVDKPADSDTLKMVTEAWGKAQATAR